MTICPHCNSDHTQSRGTRLTSAGIKTRNQCQDCFAWFQTDDVEKNEYFNKSKFASKTLEDVDKHEIFVVTGVQNDTIINAKFKKTLQEYCKRRNARLILMPIKFKYRDDSTFFVEDELMIFDAVAIHPKLRLMANLPINPAIETPLSSLENLSKGDSLIIAGTTLQMTVMPTLGTSPATLHTTGAISYPNTTSTKQGIKAKFNHSFSAIVIELDGDIFHQRVLNGDEHNGFYDIDGYYSGDKFTPLKSVEAIVLGDIHADSVEPTVISATFTDIDSMCNMLKPNKIILHDLHNQGSENHHNTDIFSRYTKHRSNTDDVEAELNITAKFLHDYVPPDTTAVIVESNHNAHLDKWLIEYPTKHHSIKNSKFFHKLMYSMLDFIDFNEYKPNAFELWLVKHCPLKLPKMIFTSSLDSYKIKDIELKLHGDRGIGGAKGSGISFAKLPTKSISGHSHSPKIHLGNYTCGTSSKLNLGYNDGTPSTWMHAHVIIHNNGKRQMIFVINGRWKK